jgi:hypothetical protein
MTQHSPTELAPIFLKKRSGRDEIRFVPVCAGCGELIIDITKANVAVVGGTAARPQPVGTHKGATVSRLDGRAFVFCWDCDRVQSGNNVPWDAAALIFRNRDDAAQQPLTPTFHSVTARRNPQ